MTNLFICVPGLLVVAWHARCRFPGWSGLLLAGPDRRLVLPLSGQFQLRVARSTRVSQHLVEIVSSASDGCEGPRLLILSDQTDSASWRRLRLWLMESA